MRNNSPLTTALILSSLLIPASLSAKDRGARADIDHVLLFGDNNVGLIVSNPHLRDRVMKTPSDSPGMTERIDKIEVSRTARAYPANRVADIPYVYSNVLTATTADVKTVVPAGAGVGKL